MGQVQGRRARATGVALAMFIMMVLAGSAGAQAPAPAPLDFTVQPATVRVGDPVAFAATIPRKDLPPVQTVIWDFGDGTIVAGSPADPVMTTAQYAYAAAGTRTVTLWVTRRDGTFTSVSHDVAVLGVPQAAFTFAPAVPSPGAVVTFDASASSDAGGIAAFTWDFGDGTTGSGATVAHAYAAPGDRTVTLTTTSAFDGRTATATATVHVDVAATPGELAAVGVSTPATTTGTGTVSGAGSATPPAAAPTSADRIRTLKILSGVRLRLAGTVTGPLTTLTSVSLAAPKGATIRVRCAGGGCAIKPFKKRVARTGSMRLAQLQRQFSAGTRITFDVTKPGFVPKRIVLTFRDGRAPSRVERCLLPGAQPGQVDVAPCPAS